MRASGNAIISTLLSLRLCVQWIEDVCRLAFTLRSMRGESVEACVIVVA